MAAIGVRSALDMCWRHATPYTAVQLLTRRLFYAYYGPSPHDVIVTLHIPYTTHQERGRSRNPPAFLAGFWLPVAGYNCHGGYSWQLAGSNRPPRIAGRQPQVCFAFRFDFLLVLLIVGAHHRELLAFPDYTPSTRSTLKSALLAGSFFISLPSSDMCSQALDMI